jgi:serine/threonine-protein kinase
MSRRKVLAYIFIVVGAFISGILIFNYVIMPGLIGRGDVVLVPDLRGVEAETARAKCINSGYSMKVMREEHSADIPEGYVISQVPEPGEGLKERRTIRVVVSAGRKMAVVPDLRGQSLRQAYLTLEGAGLRRGSISRIFSHLRGDNTVHGSSPSAGSEVPAGSRIDLLFRIKEAPRVFRMPEMVGMDFQFARERLEELGFTVGRVVNRKLDTGFPNKILSQSPPPGSAIKEGGTVEFTVSTVE